MKSTGGHFIISLDFELFWGMCDKTTLQEYGEHIKGERTAIPRILQLFEHYGIHATWATVGMLMAQNKQELVSMFPPQHLRPTYPDMRASTYAYISYTTIGEDEHDDIYHYGNNLVEKIRAVPHQEIGNHTFSHFYCMDEVHDDHTIFEADLVAYAQIAQRRGITSQSIVFPRNQVYERVDTLCAKFGISTYRGNENHWIYKARKDRDQSLLVRALRLVDHYIPISGHHTYPLPTRKGDSPINLPSSRFLRPWSAPLRVLEPLRIRRIKNAMTYAARHNEVFHLWWHPHNFGINQKENFKNLISILDHFTRLQTTYGMQSVGMAELAKYIDEQSL